MRFHKGFLFVALLLLGVLVSGCGTNFWHDGPEIIPPTVSSTNPANSATAVGINRKVTATFSEAMNPATITDTTFTLKQGTTAVAGAVTYEGTVATFTPTSSFTISTTYEATITTGATDLAGNNLAVNKTWSFTTGTSTDTTAPTVSSTIPADLAIDVATNGDITATFSEAMDIATITTSTFTLKQGTTAVDGAVTYAGTIATFTPTSNLTASTTYTATITTGATDLADNTLAVNKTWSFTTGTSTDTTAPTVSSTIPLNSATGVATDSNITATFSKAMKAATLTTSTFTLKQGTTAVDGAVSYVGTVATFNPTNDLTTGTTYEATITTGATDLAGNALAADKVWTFTTPAAGPALVDLGTAGNFAILDKATITNAGSLTTVVGDIGVSPAADTFITGFVLALDSTGLFSTSPYVTGRIYAAGPAYAEPTPTNMTTAIGDMELAYAAAAGRTSPAPVTELGAGNISGKTIVPGLYKWGTGVSMDDTGITLAGGANDVWIFQIDQTLTVASAAIVTLSGGALPQHIFWQVAGNTTLGTTSQFKGIILDETQIVMNTGATLNGRALAKTGVLMGDDCHVTEP